MCVYMILSSFLHLVELSQACMMHKCIPSFFMCCYCHLVSCIIFSLLIYQHCHSTVCILTNHFAPNLVQTFICIYKSIDMDPSLLGFPLLVFSAIPAPVESYMGRVPSTIWSSCHTLTFIVVIWFSGDKITRKRGHVGVWNDVCGQRFTRVIICTFDKWYSRDPLYWSLEMVYYLS